MTAARREPLSLPHRIRPVSVAAPDGMPPPLLLLLHGIGSNELAMAALGGEFDPRFVVISPRAPIQIEPYSFAWFAQHDGPDGPVVDATELKSAIRSVGMFVREAVGAYSLDPRRVFLTGFSQGGALALAALLTAPDGIAGVVSMSGWLPREASPHVVPAKRLRGKPALVVHGAGDETIGVALGRRADRELRRLGLAVRYAELAMGHSTTPESLSTASGWLTGRLLAEPG